MDDMELTKEQKEFALGMILRGARLRGWDFFYLKLVDDGASVAVWDERYDEPLCIYSEIYIDGLSMDDMCNTVLSAITNYMERE